MRNGGQGGERADEEGEKEEDEEETIEEEEEEEEEETVHESARLDVIAVITGVVASRWDSGKGKLNDDARVDVDVDVDKDATGGACRGDAVMDTCDNTAAGAGVVGDAACAATRTVATDVLCSSSSGT